MRKRNPVSATFTEEELKLIGEASQKERMSRSGFIGKASLEKARELVQ